MPDSRPFSPPLLKAELAVNKALPSKMMFEILPAHTAPAGTVVGNSGCVVKNHRDTDVAGVRLGSQQRKATLGAK